MKSILERKKKLEEIKKKKTSENRDQRLSKMEEFINSMKLHGHRHYPNTPSYWDDEEDWD